MKKLKNSFILAAMICLIINNCPGQEIQDSTLYQIETTDGNSYLGKIIEQDSLKVLLSTEILGDISLHKTNVKKITPIATARIKAGKLWLDNPQASRYFWSPNGYGPKKGEAYYQNIWVFWNQFTIGITNNISLGAGMIPLFLFAGTPTPIWIAPKFSIPVLKEKWNVGGGALMGVVLGEDATGFGIVYGLSTFGSRDNNVSIGLGYGYASGDWAKSPMINVSGMFRTGPRGYFLTENYYIKIDDDVLVLISLGGRSITKGGVGVDYGLFLPRMKDMDSFFAVPWIGLTVPIGKKAKQLVNLPTS
jgi:hypothetical protein